MVFRLAPLVLEINRNSPDDGPESRTSVFFKGCPMDCVWCNYPESKKVPAELSVSADNCFTCGICEIVCPQGAASPEQSGIVDREKCDLCFTCTEFCPSGTLIRLGEEMNIGEIVGKCLKDKKPKDESKDEFSDEPKDEPGDELNNEPKGEVILTGGEPTLFPEWTGGLAEELKAQGFTVLMETCGYFDYDRVREHILPHISGIYMDIKLMDNEAHRKYCGVDNDQILENFLRLQQDSAEFGYTLMPRTPLIPEITDTDENLTAIAEFYQEHGVTETELLPYDPTWYAKLENLGIEADPGIAGIDYSQNPEKLEHCKTIFQERGIECR